MSAMDTSLRRRAKEVKNSVESEKTGNAELAGTMLIPTGSTMLNLALSDTTYGGYKPGTLVNLVGDTSAGKTFLSLSMLAEVAGRKEFDKYDLVYRDIETKLSIDIDRFFRKRAERITFDPVETVEDWYKDIVKRLSKGKPFIDVLDSLDALTTEEEKKKGIGRSYQEKPLLIAQMLSRIWNDIAKSESLVHVVSQTRQNIGATSAYVPKRRAGGDALRFWCTHETWLAIKSRHKRKEEIVGVDTTVKVKKNHLTGKERTVEFSIYNDYGVDDIGSIIDWLTSKGFWKKDGQTINSEIFGKMTKQKLIEEIEGEDREGELIDYVGRAWAKWQDEVATHRKPRYE